MSEEFALDVRSVRKELGLSQSALAALTGLSNRAVQSYEQGWRRPSEMVERILLLLLIAHRNGSEMSKHCCWERKQCSLSIRKRCVAYLTRQGHLCWFFTGTLCEGKRLATWGEKMRICMGCSFMQSVLNPCAEDSDSAKAQSSCALQN